LKAGHLHVSVTVGGTIESKVLTLYNLLLEAPVKARCLHIKVVVEGPFGIRVGYYRISFFRGPFKDVLKQSA